MPNTNQPSRKDGENPPPIKVNPQVSSLVPKPPLPPTPQLRNVHNTQTPKK